MSRRSQQGAGESNLQVRAAWVWVPAGVSAPELGDVNREATRGGNFRAFVSKAF